jgi:hypothetical protein
LNKAAKPAGALSGALQALKELKVHRALKRFGAKRQMEQAGRFGRNRVVGRRDVSSDAQFLNKAAKLSGALQALKELKVHRALKRFGAKRQMEKTCNEATK